MKTLGFVGTGTIAAAFIEGLRAAGRANPVVVSPRSERVARRLSDELTAVRRARSNAQVIDESDIVFLAMRPAQVEEALEGMHFRANQTVCSFVTGLTLPELATLCPTSTVCRVLPLPMVSFGQGPLMLLPDVPEIHELVRPMGSVVLPRDEAELATLGGVSGFMSTFFQLQATQVDWLAERGVDPETANLYVRAIFAGLAYTALHSSTKLADLADEHETKGGLNERTRRALQEAGWFKETLKAIESVAALPRHGLK